MKDRRVLVTGATAGIGRQTALELAQLGAQVIVHGRSQASAQGAMEQLIQESGNPSLSWVAADFAKLEQVRGMAAEIERRFDRLHVLINNAGVYVEERTLTPDGFELTFAVNHLAPFLLTNLLLPLLERSAPSRVLTVSSMAHFRGRLDFEDLQLERRYEGYQAYANSKLANILFTFELAERLAGRGVDANCLHPGVIATKLLRAGFGGGGASLAHGAKTSVYLASAPELEGVSGRYFADQQESRVGHQARDVQARKRLWEVSEKLVGLSPA